MPRERNLQLAIIVSAECESNPQIIILQLNLFIYNVVISIYNIKYDIILGTEYARKTRQNAKNLAIPTLNWPVEV